MFLNRRKVPFVAGRQFADCGIACVAMILRFYKSYQSMNDLKIFFEVGRDGIALRDLNSLLKQFNLDTKLYKIPTGQIKSLQLPLIIFWKECYFVILEKVKNKTFYIVDPSYGRRKVKSEEFLESYSNIAIFARPNKEFIPQSRKSSVFENFKHIIFNDKSLYFKILSFSLVTYVFTIGVPIIIRNTIDFAANNHDKTNTSILFLFLGIVFLLLAVSDYLKNNHLLKLKTLIDKTLNIQVISHLMKLPYKFFDVRNKQDILFTIKNSSIVQDTFAGHIIKGIINFGSVIFILVFIAISSKLLSTIAGVLFVVNIFLILITKNTILENSKAVFIEESKIEAFKAENIHAILSLKMSSMEPKFLKNFKNKFSDYLGKYIKKESYNNKINMLFSFLNFISPIIILYISMLFMIDGKFTIVK